MTYATCPAVTQESTSSLTQVSLSAVQNGVLTQPGATALTRMFSLGSRSAKDRVSPVIACFDAAYMGAGRNADCAAMDEIMTTTRRPSFWQHCHNPDPFDPII